jgi:putative hydrolase of HD superfamily
MNNQKKESYLGIIKFFSELYMLKRNKRSGLAVIDAPQDSIADHVTVTAQIAYVLAEMEGLNAERCAIIALFHDNDETRLGDLNKVATLYIEKEQASSKVIEDQLSNLPKEVKEKILELIKPVGTPEEAILHDADWLE